MLNGRKLLQWSNPSDLYENPIHADVVRKTTPTSSLDNLTAVASWLRQLVG
jgi:hypothetical protein